ncbi:RING finger protein ETP1 [Pseudozyma hubeiensis]|nr:RING finger protein ETP1 [Pseudozyma hubeiensis]
MPTKARKAAPSRPAYFLDQQETFSIHISLFQPHPGLGLAPFQSDSRIALDQVFGTLPDTALQGQHGRAVHSQRTFLYTDRSTKSFGSPIDIRFGPLRIDWAERASDHEMSQASSSKHASSSSASANTGASIASSSSSTKPPRRKHVFHAKQPQVALPVASFEKTDSFEGDNSGSKDPNTQLVSCAEKFQGMTIGATEVAFGIVHLFRDKQDAGAKPSTSAGRQAGLENQIPEQDVGAIVAVLAVPSHLTASHFLSYIEPAVEAITHLRMVRDMHPNRCMVLIRFRDAKDAEDFHKMYNGQPFNAMDPQEICQVVYITSLTVSKHTSLPFSYPTLTNSDPWPLRPPTNAVNQPAHELPTCPVCLERMDSSVTGLMTISCQHTFHCSCLSKWGESRCPVCRYSQTGQPSAHHRRRTPRSSMDPSTPSRNGGGGSIDVLAEASDDESDADEPSCCAVCQTQQDLWVCLVCASVGCGRYKQGHAHRHFSETGHLYSLELETQRVWDYAGDGYVHRLIQNKADGKLVELPSASSANATPDRSRTLPASASYASAMSTSGTKHSGPPTMLTAARDATGHTDPCEQQELDEGYTTRGEGSSRSADDKLETIGMEYSYLLTSQLESQRHFYEDKLDKFQAQLVSLTGEMSTLSRKAQQIDELSARTTELERNNEQLKRDKDKSDKKAEKAVELARTLERDLHSERSMNKGLMDRLEQTKESEQGLKAQVTDLQEQVSDLMFFVQARDKLDQEGGEAQGGDVELRAKPTTASSRKGKARKK